MKEYFKNSLFLLCVVYIYFSSCVSLVYNTFDRAFKLVMIPVLLPLIVLALIGLDFFATQIFNIKEEASYKSKTRKQLFLTFIVFSVVCFIVLFLDYLANFPGGFSQDSIIQYSQVVNGTYNDWHPVIHTLIFFGFPYSLSSDANLIVLFQIILFSVSLGYIGMTVFDVSNPFIALIVFSMVVLNPNTLNICMYPWKDVMFAMVSALSYAVIVRRIIKKEDIRISEIIILSILFSLSILFRHNGILFTAPLILCLFLFFNYRKVILTVLLTFICLFAIKGPLYSSLNVEKPGQRLTETMGLPLTIIGECITNNPDALDDEIKEFAYEIADKDFCETYYDSSFNSVKFSGADTSIVEKTPVLKIISMALKCFVEAPRQAIDATLRLTGMVFAFIGNGSRIHRPEIVSNSLGINPIKTSYSDLANRIIEIIRNIGVVFNISFNYIGFTIMVIIVSLYLFCDLRNKSDLKYILLSLPILIYDFGTMILLTGYEWRFFYISFLVYPLVVLLLWRKEKTL